MKENSEKEHCPYTGKICYSQRGASNAISFFKHHRNKRSRFKKQKNIPVRYYYCEKCGCYHLTHYRNQYSTRKNENKRRELHWEEGIK